MTRVLQKKELQKLLKKCRKSGDMVDKLQNGGYIVINALGHEILKALPGKRGYLCRLDPKYFDQQLGGF